MAGQLILLRHGQSQWNLENRFTGWVEVDLSDTGREDARKAGQLLASRRSSCGRNGKFKRSSAVI